MNDWAVYRQDSTGNEFVVKRELSESEAETLAAHYISLGHHQHYWVDKQPQATPDFSQQLAEMIQSGSARQLALAVLRAQGAADDQLTDALLDTSDLTRVECELIIRNLPPG